MPWGYLVSVALVTCCTLAALAPIRRSPRLGRISWMLALVINELPFVAMYWLLAVTVLAFAQDGSDGPGAWVAVSLAVLTVLGLAVVAWRGAQARPATDRALAARLGEDWRTEIDPALAAGLRRRPPLATILLRPVFFGRRDVERIADLSYGDAGVRNRLDVYRHRARPSGCPTLIYFHGGGFRSGRKNREARPLMYRLASQGWVCVSANYRLSPRARFPDYLIDAKKVIAWTREHGDEYGADPSVLFVAGSSAGAHLAAMSALTPNDARFQPGFEWAETSVTAAVGLYGYYGYLDSDPHLPSSPRACVRRDAPPFFVVHGELDTYVPVESAREFIKPLRRMSTNPVVYAELPGAQHSFDLFHSLRFEAVVDAIEAFAAWVRCSPVHADVGHADAVHNGHVRQAFAHEALVSPEPRADPNALGGAITLELCGEWEHAPPCPLAPHHTSAEPAAEGVRLRILFAANPVDEAEVRARIRRALARSYVEGPDGRVSRWTLRTDDPSDVRPEEAEQAARLVDN